MASAGPYASLHLIPDNHANIPPLSFLQAGCPSFRPTNSVKALKAKALKAEIVSDTGHRIYFYNKKLICHKKSLYHSLSFTVSLTISCFSKSRLVLPFWFLPFWYLLTQAIRGNKPLNGIHNERLQY